MKSIFHHLIVFVISSSCSYVKAQVKEANLNPQAFSSIPLTSLNEPKSYDNNQNDILVLMPASLNLSASGSTIDSQSSLFKLDTDILFNQKNHNARPADLGGEAEGSLLSFQSDRSSRVDQRTEGRNGRKMNFLRGMWNKPKMSPLYLINGTVCRFVNAMPICTTLSTTGLLANNNTSGSASSVFNGGGGQVQLQPFNGNQQFQNSNNQQQQQFLNNNNQQFSNQQQFGNNQLNRAQPRPSALMDDESQDLNVESSINVTDISPTPTKNQQQTSLRPTNVSPAMIQGNVRPIINRRPLNLLSLRRPVRQGFSAMSGRSVEESV